MHPLYHISLISATKQEHLGVGFVSLTEGLDLTTPRRPSHGQCLGRPVTAALHADQVRKLYRAVISKAASARRVRIGRTSVRRSLAE